MAAKSPICRVMQITQVLGLLLVAEAVLIPALMMISLLHGIPDSSLQKPAAISLSILLTTGICWWITQYVHLDGSCRCDR